MKKNILKKLLAIVLVFAMLAPIMGNLGTNIGFVQAAEEEESVGYVIVPSSAVSITEPADETQPKIMSIKENDETYGQYADYLFAGWYTDEAATTAAASGETGAYARFVPADVLSTKVQVTNGIVTNTTNETYKDKYVMRFVSSVDSTDYKYAGFELSYEDEATNETVTLVSKTYKVFKRIDSTTGATENEVDTYNFSPKVVDTKSVYFITGKYPVAEADKDVNYTVRAYWMTKDGTKVYGRERCVSVEDGAGTTANTRLNLTVDAELNQEYSYSVSYENWSKARVTSSNVEVLTTGNGYSNIRIKTADRDTRSVTTITITSADDSSTYTTTYRNLYSKYEDENGKTRADGTWYSASEDEYIIATRADMYGFANLVDDKEDYDFTNKKVYLVSDIALNPEELEMLEGNNYLKWYTYDDDNQKVYKDAPSHTWNPIGYYTSTTDYSYFQGKFDGQGHTISGLYMDTTSRFAGLFAATDNSATVKDVKLKGSYITTTKRDVGSIAAMGKGTFDTVYSDAIVECADACSGGLVGQGAGTSLIMKNCWYAGKITSVTAEYQGIGGLVGGVVADATLTMSTCFNTGIVDATQNNKTVPCVGGLVGMVASNGTFNVSDSLNIGEIMYNTEVATNGYGSIIGYVSGKAQVGTTYGAGCTNTHRGNANTITGGAISVNAQSLIGTDAQTNMTNLSWNNTWTTVAHGIPVLSVFEKEVFDTSWYDEDKSVYVLKDKGDLYGLASLSADINFKDKTIKLANDIIVNTGDADDWAAGIEVPYYSWTPIGSATTPFKGDFDANMHTISGLYFNTSQRFGGLFAEIQESPEIKNLSLKNSYFKTTNSSADFGSILGRGCGVFTNIYSDAIVVVQGERAGGLVGNVAYTATTMNNCWFAGSFCNIGASGRYHGGLAGYVGIGLTVKNCLNTGTIKTDSTTKDPMAGGLIGYVATSDSVDISVDISDCVNVGLIQQDPTKTTNYGPIVGYGSEKVSITKETTFATTESACSHTATNVDSKYSTVAETNIIGDGASTNMSALDWTDTWTIVDYRTPVLKVFKNESDGRIDVSWFNEASYDTTNEYTLYDEEDLYGFSMIAKTKDFSGKTVKLGADIVVNEGTASADWATKSNYRQWMPIGSIGLDSKLDFQGTFDGQGYTISGLYINTTWRYAGLFASVGSTGVIQNLKLESSYMKTTHDADESKSGRDFGSISGLASGKLYNIYSNVIVDGSWAATGGLVGQANGNNVVMENCWYAGTVTNSANSKDGRGTGGLVGLLQAGSLTMVNCLNSGTVDVEDYNAVQTINSVNQVLPCAGGFIGTITSGVPAIMNQCVNVGQVVVHEDATKGYGPLIGYSNSKDSVSMSATYATDTYNVDDALTHNNMTANYEEVTETDITTDAAAAMPLLGWGVDWKAVSGAFPEIIFDYTTSASGLNATATEDETTALAELYKNRSLYQGEMHDHAKTIDGNEDGTVTLTEWATQLTDNGMDFAASLDHKQITHIDDTASYTWDESKFVYGSEAQAIITDRADQNSSGLLHFDMVFKTKAQFETVLNAYQAKFNYDATTGTFNYSNLSFTKAEFATFIKDVMVAGGFVNLPHPMQGPGEDENGNAQEYSTNLEDFIFDVKDEAGKQLIYGFHVITSNINSGNTQENYVAWKELLANGYRVYATAGSDRHAELNANTLTSIYANTTAADVDKGELVTQLQSGDFVAGSVGIQMCIGNTLMGGSCDFTTNTRLVIGVGTIHSGMLVEGHKYRVEVLNEDGIVYSQQIATDGTTKIALDTTECDFYRVEVYDATTGVRIAVGNPIWNDK